MHKRRADYFERDIRFRNERTADKFAMGLYVTVILITLSMIVYLNLQPIE
jgi:hypothetical protein